MTRTASLITINFDDLAAASREAYALVEVDLDVDIEELEDTLADSYDYRSFLPGSFSWAARSTYNQAVETNMAREAAQVALEALALSRTTFDVSLTSPSGVTYDGVAWISGFAISSSDQSVLRIAAQFVGVGELVSSNQT